MIQSLSELREQFIAEQKSFSSLPVDDPRTLRPLSLRQNKKRAKQLLNALRRGEKWSRTTSHPKPDLLSKEHLKLADAQVILAREQGFKSWPRLKHHIEATKIAEEAVSSGNPSVVDGEKHTLHIRCGNEVMYKLATAGFVGDFLNFSDAYIQGPVPAEQDLQHFIRIRSNFIVENAIETTENSIVSPDFQISVQCFTTLKR